MASSIFSSSCSSISVHCSSDSPKLNLQNHIEEITNLRKSAPASPPSFVRRFGIEAKPNFRSGSVGTVCEDFDGEGFSFYISKVFGLSPINNLTGSNLGSSSSPQDEDILDADWRSFRAKLVAGKHNLRSEDPSTAANPAYQPLPVTIGETSRLKVLHFGPREMSIYILVLRESTWSNKNWTCGEGTKHSFFETAR